MYLKIIKEPIGGGGSAPTLFRLERWVFLAAKQQLGNLSNSNLFSWRVRRSEYTSRRQIFFII